MLDNVYNLQIEHNACCFRVYLRESTTWYYSNWRGKLWYMATLNVRLFIITLSIFSFIQSLCLSCHHHSYFLLRFPSCIFILLFLRFARYTKELVQILKLLQKR